MGAVYAAHDDDLDEDIALKVLRPDLGRDADFQRRLKAEVRLARRVSHPNVCRVHDIGVDDELVFVTMELVRGHTLRERLAETTPAAPSRSSSRRSSTSSCRSDRRCRPRIAPA